MRRREAREDVNVVNGVNGVNRVNGVNGVHGVNKVNGIHGVHDIAQRRTTSTHMGRGVFADGHYHGLGMRRDVLGIKCN